MIAKNLTYPWQTSCLTAIEMIATSGGKDFLAAVTPSGGKTILGLEYAHRTLAAGHIDIVVALVPSIPIQSYWIDEAAKFPAPRRACGRMTFTDQPVGRPSHKCAHVHNTGECMTSLLDDDELGVNLCNKYPSHTGDDIYTRILDEALAALLRSRETPTSLEVARYVVAVLNLDPEICLRSTSLRFLRRCLLRILSSSPIGAQKRASASERR
jgi:hypothetical protein